MKGSVSVERSGHVLHIRQSGAQAHLQRTSFDVVADETTLIEFDDPAGANSSLVIEVTGGQPSTIAGSIRAVGGTVRLQNSHGILVTANARVEAGSICLLGQDITNLGAITSENGQIILQANGGIVCNAGTLLARKADGSGGTILLDCGHNAAGTATVTSTGTIDARGLTDGTSGGTVELLGDQVGLFEQGLVDVRGPGGGGKVLMGGDYRGGNPEIKNARAVYISSEAGIRADGLVSGNGGKVIVFSDNCTRCYGSISARGGAQSGRGGFVEASGHYLDFQGEVISLASRGAAGSLLLDPTDLVITNNVNQNINGSSPFVPTGTPSLLSWTTINAALSSGAVTVTTSGSPSNGQSGNITIVTASPTLNSAHSLTIDAVGALTINFATGIVNTGTGSVLLEGANGVTINASASITAGGPLTIANALILGGNVTLSGSTVTLESTVDATTAGGQGLTVSGTAFLDGAVGGATAPASLTLNNAADLNGGAISTTGNQTYKGAATLGANTTLTSTGGAIAFDGTVDGAHSLTVNSAEFTIFDGAVGGATSLTSLTTGATGSTLINTSAVTTTGAQTYNDPVTLETNTTLTSTGGNITMAGTVNGDFNLSVTTAGIATFDGAVGGNTALFGFGTAGAGSTTLNCGTVTTVGGLGFENPVTLGAATILTCSGFGNITFLGTVNGAQSLTAATSGSMFIDGAVGNTTPLTSLTLNTYNGEQNEGMIMFNGSIVTTTGSQTYNDVATLEQNTTLTSTGSGAIALGTLNGAKNLMVNTAGITTFGGTVGNTTPLTSLTTDAAGSTTINATVTTSGAQTYNDPVTLAQNTTLTSTGSGNITLAGTVNATNSFIGLIVNTGGTTTFGGAVGNTTPLQTLTTDAAGTTAINGGRVTTSGTQTYNDTVTLGANTVFSSGILELEALHGNGDSLTFNNGGSVTINGAISGVNVLTVSGSCTLATGGTISATSVTVSGGGRLAGNGTINAPVVVQAGGILSPGASVGALTINNSLTLSGTALLQLNESVPTSSLVQGLTDVAYNGTLTVTNLAGTLALGDQFYLFKSAAYDGAFAVTNLPALSAGLAWNTASLGSNGSIVVVTNPSSVTISDFGFIGGHFDFYITGPVAQQVVVQASTNLPAWLPIWTNTFGTAGPLFFSDPQGNSYSDRFYRAVSP